MNVRAAQETDIPRLIDLLHQVLEVHAAGRPDIFVSGTTKYGYEELKKMIEGENTPMFVLEDDAGIVRGYAMCGIETSDSSNMQEFTTLYIDDICVDEAARGNHYGSALYQAVKDYAKSIGAYHITLNVWSCNPTARKFYEAIGLKPMKTTMEEVL
ncbi:MAG: GNAT family N-acetyltransferase [Solobacterium sp.]|nr:GNAT family N-acetyltransferase [Solobacterium sp.]